MTSPRRLLVRFSAVLSAALLAAFGMLVGLGALSPAHADVPVGWSDPADVNILHAVLLFGAIPLAMVAVIGLLVYGPSLARGESVAPEGTSTVSNHWLGGPSKGTAALAAPDSEDSHAGGARGRW